MKNQLIAVALLISASMPAAAETWQTKCAEISQLATSIMNARQNGMPMARIIELSTGSGGVEDLAHLMTIDAFEEPRYNTANYQARAKERFRDAWYLKCVKVLRKS